MQRAPVSSSAIISIGYASEHLTLEIEFSSGAVYVYMGVANETYAAFMSAESKGTFFNEQIKDRYPHQRS